MTTHHIYPLSSLSTEQITENKVYLKTETTPFLENMLKFYETAPCDAGRIMVRLIKYELDRRAQVSMNDLQGD